MSPVEAVPTSSIESLAVLAHGWLRHLKMADLTFCHGWGGAVHAASTAIPGGGLEGKHHQITVYNAMGWTLWLGWLPTGVPWPQRDMGPCRLQG